MEVIITKIIKMQIKNESKINLNNDKNNQTNNVKNDGNTEINNIMKKT